MVAVVMVAMVDWLVLVWFGLVLLVGWSVGWLAGWLQLVLLLSLLLLLLYARWMVCR